MTLRSYTEPDQVSGGSQLRNIIINEDNDSCFTFFEHSSKHKHFEQYFIQFLEKVIEDGDDAKEIQKWVEEHVLPLVGAVTKATRK